MELYGEPMKTLTGHTIRAIHVERGEHRIIFETNSGRLAYETEGDCCSETWFADIVGVSALLGGEVRLVNSTGLPNVEDGRNRDEVDEFYGVKITTDLGVADIIYRNSSNGYYGGSCGPSTNISLDDTVKIEADWQAGAKVYD